jgi:hypothetical protein
MPPFGTSTQGLGNWKPSPQMPHVEGSGHALVMVIDDEAPIRKIVQTWRGASGVRGEGLP